MKFTGFKDTDKFLLERLSDRELFSVMQTNKEYLKLGQDFFEKRMKKKYPLLATKKPEGITWYKYYIDTVYYISKLKEKYNMDYYEILSFDPKIIYYNLKNYDPDERKVLLRAIFSFLKNGGEKERAITFLRDNMHTPHGADFLFVES